jgi:hypothetical protein
MKLRTVALAVAILVPAGTLAQAPPALKSQLTAMQANVGKISNAGEKERWQTNAQLWEVKINRVGKLELSDIAKMRPILETMKVNVSKITDGAEKERWQANVDAWQTLIDKFQVYAKADRDLMRARLETIKANVMKIRVAAEKERWEANRELWTLTLRTL